MTRDMFLGMVDEYEFRTIRYIQVRYNWMLGEHIEEQPALISGLVHSFQESNFLVLNDEGIHLIYYVDVRDVV